MRKAGQGLSTLLQDIAPSDSGSLFKAVYSSGVIQRTLQCNGEEATSSSVDETMMSALAECYRAADSWETRRQVLSIMADKLTLNQLRHWIPDLSQYRFTEARRHCLVYGRGAPVLTVPTPRMRVSTAQIDHFIAFITSPHIIQDLPFGERTIMLSTKETIKVPNVIRMIIPERIVIQYMTYCQESGFTPLSRATLLRILSTCAASVRTSVQGLDYVSSAGAEAFDDLCDVVETLGDVGQGMGWAKQQENNLRASKRYLKSDFKVGVTPARQIPPPRYVTRPRSLSCASNMASAITHSGFFALEKHPLPLASSLIEIPLNSITSIVLFCSVGAIYRYIFVSFMVLLSGTQRLITTKD